MTAAITTTRRAMTAVGLVLLALAGAAARPGAPAGTIEGSWRLVEQRYERGGHDFAPREEPARLTVRSLGGAWEAAVEIYGQRGAWPLYPAPEGPRPLGDVVVEFASDGRGMTARYTVLPAPGDDTALYVTERYELDARGRLAGTMRLEFHRGGRARGGFTWRRVWVREDGP